MIDFLAQGIRDMGFPFFFYVVVSVVVGGFALVMASWYSKGAVPIVLAFSWVAYVKARRWADVRYEREMSDEH